MKLHGQVPVTVAFAVHWRDGATFHCGYCGVDLTGRLFSPGDRSEWAEERNACWAIGAGRPVTLPEEPRGEPVPGPTDAQRKALDEAQAIATRYDARLAQLRGKRIRVLRAVIYEGPAEAVLAQLARTDPCWTLVGVDPIPQLQKLVTERYWKTDVVPRWDGLGGKCSIDWLPTEAVYVEPDEVDSKAPIR